MALAEVDRRRCHQDPYPVRWEDHGSSARARTSPTIRSADARVRAGSPSNQRRPPVGSRRPPPRVARRQRGRPSARRTPPDPPVPAAPAAPSAPASATTTHGSPKARAAVQHRSPSHQASASPPRSGPSPHPAHFLFRRLRPPTGRTSNNHRRPMINQDAGRKVRAGQRLHISTIHTFGNPKPAVCREGPTGFAAPASIIHVRYFRPIPHHNACQWALSAIAPKALQRDDSGKPEKSQNDQNDHDQPNNVDNVVHLCLVCRRLGYSDPDSTSFRAYKRFPIWRSSATRGGRVSGRS